MCYRPSQSVAVCAEPRELTTLLLTVVPFTIIGNAYDQILGQQPLCIVPDGLLGREDSDFFCNSNPFRRGTTCPALRWGTTCPALRWGTTCPALRWGTTCPAFRWGTSCPNNSAFDFVICVYHVFFFPSV